MPRLAPPVVPRGSIARLGQPSLTGDGGLYLRAWNEADVGAVVGAFLDPDIQRWHLGCLDAEEARRWIEAWHERWSNESDASWAITTGGDALGYIALRSIDLEYGTVRSPTGSDRPSGAGDSRPGPLGSWPNGP